MSKKIAIQGDKASFHDIAARKFYDKDIEIISCDSFSRTFESLKSGEADSAVCAIENSLFGSINETYDLLVDYDFEITGEVYLRVIQCLVVLPGTKLEDIKEVYSHPVAIAQCEEYLDTQLSSAKRLEFYDTAASVELIKNTNNKSVAAIASREAATLFAMEVLAEEIETNKQNYTRFIIIEPKGQKLPNSNKTSLIIKTAHKPGSLYYALGVFANRSINLSKIQSRPIIGKAWHYMFYVDVAIGSSSNEFIKATKELELQGCDVRILGSYAAGNKT